MAPIEMNPKSLLSPRLTDWRDTCVAVGLFALVATIFSGLVIPADWVYRGAVDLPYYAAQETIIRRSLHSGSLPLWNIYFNEPLLANPQAAVLYPPALLLRWLPAEMAVRWLVTFHLWLAGLGMYWLLRGWQISRLAALGAALAFAFSNTVIWRPVVGHVTMLYAIPWVAWLYFFYYRLLLQRRWSDFVFSAACIVMLILAGHVQFSAIALFVPAAHFVFYSIGAAVKGNWKQILSALGVSIGLGIISLGLMAVQLLPLLEYLPLTSRSVGFTLEEASFGGLELCNMVSSHLSIIAIIWPAYGICSQLHEASLYSVLPSWWLVYIAVRFGRGEKRWLALWSMLLLLFSLLLATGIASPVYRILYEFMPFMRVPGRFTVWWAVAMPILIGLGLERLLETESRAELISWRKFLLLLTVLPIALFLLAMVLRTYLSNPALISDPLWISTVLPVIVISLVPLIIWVYPLIRLPDFPALQRGPIILFWLGFDLILALMLVLQMNHYNSFETDISEIKGIYNSLVIDPTQVRLHLQGENENRYAAFYGIPALQFYSANLHYSQNLTLLGYKRSSFAQAAGYEAVVGLTEIPDVRVVQRTPHGQLVEYEGNPPRALVINNFVLATSDEETLQLMSLPDFDFRTKVALLELPPSLTLDDEPVTAQIDFLEYDSNSLRLQVESNRLGLLVLFDAFYPGWEATVNGQPTEILRVNYASRGMVIPAGVSEIDMLFRPASVRIGAWISMGTLLLLIALTALIKRPDILGKFTRRLTWSRNF